MTFTCNRVFLQRGISTFILVKYQTSSTTAWRCAACSAVNNDTGPLVHHASWSCRAGGERTCLRLSEYDGIPPCGPSAWPSTPHSAVGERWGHRPQLFPCICWVHTHPGPAGPHREPVCIPVLSAAALPPSCWSAGTHAGNLSLSHRSVPFHFDCCVHDAFWNRFPIQVHRWFSPGGWLRRKGVWQIYSESIQNNTRWESQFFHEYISLVTSSWNYFVS